MKIKEVCKRTGLTERTVRYYVEEKLIEPRVTFINGRNYRNYSEQNVAELITIADLRKLFFSINEIKEMMETPGRIAELVASYRLELKADAKAKAAIVQALDKIDLASIGDVNALAENLKSVSANLQLPKRDVTPSFGRFDSETKEEREYEYQQFLERQAKRYSMGKAIVFTIASIQVISAIISSFVQFSFFSLLISIITAIALYAGVSWVRYLYVFSALLAIILGFSLLTLTLTEQLDVSSGFLLFVSLYTIANMIYSAGASVLLLFNNSVKEFLYAQKNG